MKNKPKIEATGLAVRRKRRDGDEIRLTTFIPIKIRKRGGRIEVLGNTPLRSANNASPFRSSPELRKPPTPVTRARKA